MYKILAVDDSPTMHRLFKMIFNNLDYELRLADCGSAGLELVQDFSPDMILLDFIMPKMNGFQFCKILRQEMGINTPVLLITSKAEDVGNRFVEKFSNIEYIAKPFQPDDLLNKIQETMSSSARNKSSSVTENGINNSSVEAPSIEKQTGDNDKIIDVIVNKIEQSVVPVLRNFIEKQLSFETGYMISDKKGDDLNLEKLSELISEGKGEIVIYNDITNYHIYYEDGVIVYAWEGDSKIEDLFELFQDVSNTCLLEVEDFSELYESLREVGLKDEFIKRCFIFYIMSLLDKMLNEERLHYFTNEIELNPDFKAKTWVHLDNLYRNYSKFVEEGAEINKIIFDYNLKPIKTNMLESNLTDFEKRLLSLCSGDKTIKKILSFFGRNSQFVKNSVGTLILSGYIKI